MPARVEIPKIAEASVDNAAPGEVVLFCDTADSLVKTKDEAGVIRILTPGVAADLQNASPNVVQLDGDAEPTAVGQLLMITTFGPPHTAGFVDAALAGKRVDQRVAAITASDTAEIGELVLVDLDAAAGDVTVTLPPAVAGLVDQEIWIKIETEGFPVNGRKVIIAPDGVETIDGLAAGDGGDLEMVTNYEWRKMRVHRDGGKWMFVG